MPMRSLWQKVRIQERVQFHPRHARSRSKNAIPTSGCERMREWVYIEGVNGKKKKEKINKYIIYIKKKKKKRSLHCRLYLSRIMYFLHCRILSYDPQDLYHAQKFIQKKKKCSLPPHPFILFILRPIVNPTWLTILCIHVSIFILSFLNKARAQNYEGKMWEWLSPPLGSAHLSRYSCHIFA